MGRFKKTRSFFTGFFTVIIILVYISGMIIVDNSKSLYAKDLIEPIFSYEKLDDLNYDISLMGKKYGLNLNSLNTVAMYLQKYSGIILPAKYRLIFQTREIFEKVKDILYDYYLEYEFQNNIL